MMGRTHSSAGMVLSLAAAPLLVSTGIVEANGYSYMALAIAGAGAAMVPDFDHRHATIAHCLGPVSKAVAIFIEKVSGGHRNGTHSILGWAVFVAISVGFCAVGGLPLGMFLAFLLAVGMAGLQVKFSKKSIVLHTLICIAIGYWLIRSSMIDAFPVWLIPWACAIGYFAHIGPLGGDMLTKEGCPLLWPFNKTRFKVANVTTDHFTERVILGPLLGIIAIVQVLWLAGYGELIVQVGKSVWESARPYVA